MAAGGSSKASAGALEAALDRKLQSVTNTMESIQSLSSWCIENKRYHGTIVHYWLKWFRRSAFNHRLNLFYLANDVIQNCKRKNAIVYREAFADVLPEAASLVRDASVSKSVERIFKIWEERNVYQEDVIASFRSALKDGGLGKRERSKSSRPKVVEKVPEAAPVNPKAALKSKIVAEFRPQSLIDSLLTYKRSVDSVDFKEKQLSNMRVDVCSTETLKRLKDKAGGKKFSKDFEEASAKLEEYVNLLDKQVKSGPSLTDSLENAGIFYEAQYREVKVVVNAYKTFANRVSNLKKKLDQLKATLPDPEESPVPSPTIDAPSPTGSESPFQGMGDVSPLSPEAEPILPDSPEPPKDNRMVEDMELSDVDADEEIPNIILEEMKELPAPRSSVSITDGVTITTTASTTTSTAVTDTTKSASIASPPAAPASILIGATAPVSVYSPSPTPVYSPAAVSAPAPVSTPSPALPAVTVSTPAKTVTSSTISPSIPLALPNLANVDLGKISSILSSLTSVMKTTGVSPASKPSPGTPTTPTTSLGTGQKPPAQAPPNPLANILSKVEITPESILSALSKTQGPSTPSLQGLSSLIQNVSASSALSTGALTHSTPTAPVNTTVQNVKDRSTPSITPPFVSKSFGYSPTSNTEVHSTSVSSTTVVQSASVKQTGNAPVFSSQPPLSTERTINQSSEISKPSGETESSSLEMKIHNFLKGNPGFSGLDLNIPILSGLGSNTVTETTSEFQRGPMTTSLDNVDGTPVRDERSGTPTQDEMMDKPTSNNVDTVSLISKIISPDSSTPSSSRSPLLNKDNDFQKLLNMSSYRSFGLGGSSPSAYLQPAETVDKPSLIESPLDKFYPETFHEDEDYRDFDYSGPPPSAVGNIEKGPLKANMLLESEEYPPVPPSFSQSQDYGRQSFQQSKLTSYNSGESCGQLSPSSQLYESFTLRDATLESDRSPSPPKGDSFFPPETNRLTGLHSGAQQTQYPDSPLSLQNRSHNFPSNNNNLPPPGCRTPVSNVEQAGSSVSASSTMEFKNMLKNASRRPSEDNQCSHGSKGHFNEDVKISGVGHTAVKAEDRKLEEEHYRIETRVSSSCVDLPESTEEKGAPIETLGYHNTGNSVNIGIAGEPIKTVESIRVGVKGNRGLGIDGVRGDWFEMGSTGSPFDEGLSSADEQPSISGSSGVGGFEAQYEEHVSQYPDAVSNFRTNSMPPFDHHLPPPSMVPPIDRGGPFQIENTGPPSGPPPILPPDHGSHFARDIPVPSHLPPVDQSNPMPLGPLPPPPDHGGNPFSGPPPREHSGIPFSPPPILDMRNPFSQDHGALHQGAMKEHYGMHPGSSRDLGAPPRDHNGPPLGMINEAMPPHSRDHHGAHIGPPHNFVALHHRDNMNQGGLRHQRPQFRPREPYHNLKRPRPPFGRGHHFYAPKRPFYPPRY
ncbi:regulation of nuclear pre-mRNA domain-containing protein 2 [Rhinophrynus dorsalis]